MPTSGVGKREGEEEGDMSPHLIKEDIRLKRATEYSRARRQQTDTLVRKC